MGTIVAIGGGELRLNETLEIDRYIVKMSGKEVPLALFIPTASGESQGYVDVFNNVYGDTLGCKTDSLLFLTQNMSDTEIQNKISQADIIYVGGGNTQKMMEEWKSRNIDKYLKRAYENGTILSGLSAGSICWFKYGHSDSNKDITGEYCFVEGIDLIHFLHCPHYNERPDFDKYVQQHSCPAIAIEDNCAVIFKDEMYMIIKSQEYHNAYLIKNQDGGVVKILINNKSLLSIDNLLL